MITSDAKLKHTDMIALMAHTMGAINLGLNATRCDQISLTTPCSRGVIACSL